MKVRRREFITLLGGAAAAPLTARAQHGERVRRVGVLLNVNVGDPDRQANLATFAEALRRFGWVDGGNVKIETRWAGGDPAASRRQAEQLVALAPMRAGRPEMPSWNRYCKPLAPCRSCSAMSWTRSALATSRVWR